MTDRTWLVVGLGNPGPRYAGNRHNVGQMVLDELAARTGSTFRAHKAQAAVAEARLGVLPGGRPGPRVVLAKPTTYMNVSGGPVAGLVRFFSIDLENVLVVHDELDIPFGSLRLKRGGGEGGHNGLRDITKALGTKDYVRVRVGIGRPPGRMDPADFVLRDFSTTERKDLPFLLGDAADAVELILTAGLEAAQQKVHTAAP
ncbi:MAG TPA: aminoacyl-tRNA hydrolase [Actinomycetales bacterium]|nr:aminoacyl-tRNA hydrolase [Actinomycetales bacterium]